jgi:hypothetical protein
MSAARLEYVIFLNSQGKICRDGHGERHSRLRWFRSDEVAPSARRVTQHPTATTHLDDDRVLWQEHRVDERRAVRRDEDARARHLHHLR